MRAGKVTRSRFILGLLVVLSPIAVHAQVAGGAIGGTVMEESSGAVLPKAHVVIRNTATGIATEVAANESGVYQAPNLLPGPYEITASVPGFLTVVRRGVVLTVGSALVLDLRLRPGGLQESVEVTAATSSVDTSSPTLGTVIPGSTVRELPLNGRDWTNLATLQPGVASVRTQAPAGATSARGNRGYGDEMTVAGHRPQENNYRIDGVSINDYSNGAPGSAGGLNLGVDAIAEFSVLTSNYSAEYGRTSGGVINATTRSGTSAFHGTAFEFLRDDALDARNFFDGATKPPLRRHQFGATLGGPIQKEKTFFFAAYEGLRLSQGVSSRVSVPSPAAREGRLSTGAVTVDPAVRPFLSFWPLPNGPLLGAGDTGTFTAVATQEQVEDFVTGRIDHRFSQRDSLFATFMFDDGTYDGPDALANVLFGNVTTRHLGALEWTRTLRSNFTNSVRVGFNRTKGVVNDPGAAINPAAGDLSLGTAPGRAAAILTVPGLTSTAGGIGGNSYFQHIQNSYQLYDDAFLTKGNHVFKFGGSFERIEYNQLGLRRPNGAFAFGSLQAFLTNRPTSLSALDLNTLQEALTRTNVIGAYFNDTWRVRPRLTLNLGLRYEMSTLPREAKGRLTAVRELAGGPIINVDSYFTRNPTKYNFEPRVGVAWDPKGDAKTAIRAGFAVYDVLPLPWMFTPKAAQGTPFNLNTTVRNLPAGSFPKTAYNLVDFRGTAVESVYSELEPKRNYMLNWNVTIQRQLLREITLTTSYVGSRGVHNAFGVDDSNIVYPIAETPQGLLWPSPRGSGTNVNPRAGGLRSNWWDGDSRYRGLHMQLSKAMSHGFQAQASFTWSRCTDTGSAASRSDQFTNGISVPFFDKQHREGFCDFHIERIFTFNALWNAPGPKSGLASALLGDWQLGAILNTSTGVPFTPIISGDPLGLNGTGAIGFPNRLDTPECENPVNPGNTTRYIKTECFTAPNPITLNGNSGRNIAIGPGLFNLDLALYKNIPLRGLTKDARAQLRVEFFNVLNHPNFAVPLGNNAVFNQTGQPVGSAGLITATQTPSRQVQLGVRVNW